MRKHFLPGGRGDLCGAGKPGPNLVRRIVERDHHLEVLGFLAGNRALATPPHPVDRRIAVLPISITCPLNVLFGMASMVISAV